MKEIKIGMHHNIENMPYAITFEGIVVAKFCIFELTNRFGVDGARDYIKKFFSRWMPLPEPPKEDAIEKKETCLCCGEVLECGHCIEENCDNNVWNIWEK